MQKTLPRRAELAWLVKRYLWRVMWNFKIIFSTPHFTIILSKKWSFQDLKFYSTNSSHSRWCGFRTLQYSHVFLNLSLFLHTSSDQQGFVDPSGPYVCWYSKHLKLAFVWHLYPVRAISGRSAVNGQRHVPLPGIFPLCNEVFSMLETIK